jgi:DNA repair protein RecO (recombination protein O)
VSASESVGLILHSRRYRENSKIIEAFTLEHGRVALVARVATKKAGKRANGLQPFHESLFRWKGKGELQNLYSLDSLTIFRLKDKAAICGMYCNEILMHLTQKFLPLPELYACYRQTLEGLAGGLPLSPCLRSFEMTLLEQLGYGLNFETDCQTAEPLWDNEQYYYHAQQGFSRQSLGKDSIEIAGNIIQKMRSRDFSGAEVASSSRRVLGSAIQIQLGNRPLKSRQLLLSISKYQ